MGEVAVVSGDFQGIFGGFFFNIHLVSDVLRIFVIKVLSQSELPLSAYFLMLVQQLRTLFPKFCSLKSLKKYISANFSSFNCELYVQRIISMPHHFYCKSFSAKFLKNNKLFCTTSTIFNRLVAPTNNFVSFFV